MKKRTGFSNMDRAIAALKTPDYICALARGFEASHPGLSFSVCCFALGELTSLSRSIEKDLDAIIIQHQREQAERAVAS